MQTDEKKWYAVYTRPRNEKVIYAKFLENKIEALLPLQKELRQWKDRKKWVEKVMFTSYVFVRIYKQDYHKILNTQGVVKFITINKTPCEIPNKEIELIKKLTDNNFEIITETYNFNIGDNVEIINGSLKGVKGKLLEYKGKKRVVLTIEILKTCLLIDIESFNIKPVSEELKVRS